VKFREIQISRHFRIPTVSTHFAAWRYFAVEFLPFTPASVPAAIMATRRNGAVVDEKEELNRKLEQLRAQVEGVEAEKLKLVSEKKQKQFQIDSLEALVKKRETDIKEERSRREAAERAATAVVDQNESNQRKVHRLLSARLTVDPGRRATGSALAR
jgi:septal ring factor EnvC (AmiA/AmiB activator)